MILTILHIICGLAANHCPISNSGTQAAPRWLLCQKEKEGLAGPGPANETLQARSDCRLLSLDRNNHVFHPDERTRKRNSAESGGGGWRTVWQSAPGICTHSELVTHFGFSLNCPSFISANCPETHSSAYYQIYNLIGMQICFSFRPIPELLLFLFTR